MLRQTTNVTQKITTTLSKKLQESVEILAMPSTELAEYIEKQLEENPFLERDYDAPYISSHDQLYGIAYQDSFAEYLISQLPLLKLTGTEAQLAIELVHSLNDHGFLEKAAFDEKNESLRQKLKALEPVGVFSFDVKECLLEQLAKFPGYNWVGLLDNLDLLKKHEFKKAAHNLGVSEAEIKEMMGIISKLNFYPSSSYEQQRVDLQIIDIFIVEKEGEYVPECNEEALPKIFLNSELYARLKNEDIKFAKSYYKKASFILKAIEQRTTALLAVCKFVCKYQYGYFRNGVEALKPMALRNVSEATGLHESTISRLSNKVLATPHGIVALKFFFNSSIKSALFDEDVSSKAVQRLINDIVANEDKINRIHSDDEIASKLKEQGLNISRRTVNKYRELMKIPPSNVRKRLKRVV